MRQLSPVPHQAHEGGPLPNISKYLQMIYTCEADAVISWIEMNFGETKQVTALAIQPCPSASHGYRSKLEMRHSVDGRAYTKHPQLFAPDGTQMLTVPVMAQYMRIYPLNHRWSIGIRFDVLGCELGNMISCDQWRADVGFDGHPKTVLCQVGTPSLQHVGVQSGTRRRHS
ncbi:lactadherin-like isoform X2 [Syngnathus scovelli]|uniref:lactadherin-like isoform X2 n=1 Tax=Syngnathus scovelli TaxID=161590 RepID=UPI0021107E90|nr:lactadherin-like isoform X2 [Syngnathus scovelli]